MGLQNRVDPSGTLWSDPARGEFMGNRGGALHDADQRIVRAQKTRSWIICRTAFKGRRRELMQPGHYTELFFLDEVTALAAGHRPCFECRRADANAFAEAFARGRDRARLRAPEIDACLATERRRRADDADRLISLETSAALPDGSVIRQNGTHYAVRAGKLLPWSFGGYTSPLEASALTGEPVYLVTPPATVAALRNGYRPAFHSRAWKPGT
ncbi:hypothetical protein PZ897_01335 [Hoeflea sp. YIM 152468]|uniref:hypothetical protein n=1 Tax=Hoeflea sp. YIM 152468 TaxID=3031759 RepID=UPI0023DA8331|nr:hypothetical protein [Hoeflea sp. YIM 152468]MDF1606811.1 hypothetical protein [Hoeflea sp. YIM 152468]